MTETTVGREPVQVVEFLQPLCTNTFGSAPCTASGTGDTKCYNTYATCQDQANYALGTALSLFFVKGTVADIDISGVDYAIPSLVSVSTSPTKINLASSNPDAQGLGNRALCTLVFNDHQHTDRIVDPYLSGRSWNPLDAERGTYWGRWLERNKYRQGIQINVYEGYAGQALSAMQMRTYFLTEVKRNGERVTITGKDILYRVEERKAQAPFASVGELYTDITAVATTFEVAGALVSEYDASGTIRIDDEIMTYTGVATSTNGIAFSGVTRGTDNTVAEEHEGTATVQQCLRFEDRPVQAAIRDLLRDYAGVNSTWIPYSDWATEGNTYLSFYNLNALITEPTSVIDLVSEIQEQCLCYVWWDERAREVKFRAIRGVDDVPPTLTDEANILAGTFSLTEQPRERVSQVWIHYAMNDFVENPKSYKAYLETYILANLDSESEEAYGEPSIRKIYARFLSSSALAENTASKLIARYVDVPTQAKFRMDAKDRAYGVGDIVKISHPMDRDQYGARKERQWLIVSAEEVMPGETVEVLAEDVTLYGRIHYVMAGGTPDYPGYDSAPFKNCYIGDAAGLLSDGQPAGLIS